MAMVQAEPLHADYPSHWPDRYNEGQQTRVMRLIDWIKTNNKSAAWLGAAASLGRASAQQLLRGEYPGSVEQPLRQLEEATRRIDARDNVRETPFIASSVSRLVFACCARARRYHSFGIISAEVGTGKSRALREYTERNGNTVLIQADPQMSPSSLLDDLLMALGAELTSSRATRERKYKEVVKRLAGTDTLLILDEAETVNPHSLHHLRRIRDKAAVGVVLAGTPKLHALISPRSGQFDQIRSRTCYWPKPIRTISREDMDAVALAAFEDLGEVDEQSLAALWLYCRGSMRMLVEDLMPAIRDYGLKKHPLSADLVHAVAADVLSL